MESSPTEIAPGTELSTEDDSRSGKRAMRSSRLSAVANNGSGEGNSQTTDLSGMLACMTLRLC